MIEGMARMKYTKESFSADIECLCRAEAVAAMISKDLKCDAKTSKNRRHSCGFELVLCEQHHSRPLLVLGIGKLVRFLWKD